jgi:hypothetical protein
MGDNFFALRREKKLEAARLRPYLTRRNKRPEDAD